MERIHELNEDLRQAGAWVFAGGLHPPDVSTVVQVRGHETLVTDGRCPRRRTNPESLPSGDNPDIKP